MIRDDDASLLNLRIPEINSFYDAIFYGRHGYVNILSTAIRGASNKCARVLLDNIYAGYLPSYLINCSNEEFPLFVALKKDNVELARELILCIEVDIHASCYPEFLVEKRGLMSFDYLSQQRSLQWLTAATDALFPASQLGCLDIVNFLLKYGADPTSIDNYGQTAFDYAVERKYINIAEMLLSHTQGNIPANRNSFTPMMVAAHYNARSLVNFLFKILSNDRAVDDLLRLACRYTIDDSMQNYDRALYFFQQGLNRNKTQDDPILHAVYGFQRECQTLEELKSIESDKNALKTHALLVSQRLYLKYRDADFYIDIIKRQSENYRRDGLFDRSLKLGVHALELMLQVDNNLLNSNQSFLDSLYLIIGDLRRMVEQTELVPITFLIAVHRWTFDQYEGYFEWSHIDLLLVIIRVSNLIYLYSIIVLS